MPSPTHWVAIGDNHVPLDVWCIVEAVDEEGNGFWLMAYKSSKTGAWIDGGGGAVEEECKVTYYSILTDRYGVTKKAPD